MTATAQADVAVAMIAVITFATVVVLWVHERRWDRHEAEIAVHHEQLETLAGRIQSLADFLGVDVHDARDDSPAALAMTYAHDCEHTSMQHGADGCNVPGCPCAFMSWNESDYDYADTEEFPAVPATVPDGIAIQVQSALLRPSPVPRGKSAEWVEDALEELRARNTERMARTATKGD